jgi:hypothetical protein
MEKQDQFETGFMTAASFMLNAEEARGSLRKLDDFFPPFSNFVLTFSRPF